MSAIHDAAFDDIECCDVSDRNMAHITAKVDEKSVLLSDVQPLLSASYTPTLEYSNINARVDGGIDLGDTSHTASSEGVILVSRRNSRSKLVSNNNI